ncbi:MAG: hypothetical protein WC552_02940 [Candidatus Omnitrophota bacterium]
MKHRKRIAKLRQEHLTGFLRSRVYQLQEILHHIQCSETVDDDSLLEFVGRVGKDLQRFRKSYIY